MILGTAAAMPNEPDDKLDRIRERLRQAREDGATVIVRHPDGTIKSTRHVGRLPNGHTEWTEAENPAVP